jgi:hypothetical protein
MIHGSLKKKLDFIDDIWLQGRQKVVNTPPVLVAASANLHSRQTVAWRGLNRSSLR